MIWRLIALGFVMYFISRAAGSLFRAIRGDARPRRKLHQDDEFEDVKWIDLTDPQEPLAGTGAATRLHEGAEDEAGSSYSAAR